MDELKKLSYDVKVYRDLLNDYTSDPYIIQAVDNLNKCIESNDLSGVILFLERLKDWYESNINKIKNNDFVMNFDSHAMAKEQISKYYSSILKLDPIEENEMLKKGEKKMENNDSKEVYNIFISHSSKDEQICTAFVNLLEILGVPESNILYSSSERVGIPADMDIFDYLKSSISKKFNVYYMLSDHYYDSVYCLNEMGAAWINQNEYSLYILPNLTRGIEGVIDRNKKGYRLDNIINLNQLRAKISNDFNSNISDNKWDEEKEKFMSIVSEVNKKHS